MALQDDLKQKFDTLSERLREEMSRQVSAALDEIAAAAEAATEAARQEASDAARRDTADATRDAVEAARREAAEASEEAIDAARREAADQARREAAEAAQEAIETARREADEAARSEIEAARREWEQREQAAEDTRQEQTRLEGQSAIDSARMLDGIRAIDDSRSLTAVLDALVGAAAKESGRAAVLLMRAGSFRAWRFVGFGPDFQNATSIEISTDRAGILTDAVESGTPARGADVPPFAADATEGFALPIAISGQVIAVLYSDNRVEHGATPSPAALEVLSRHAGRALESLTAFKAARALLVPAGTADKVTDQEAEDLDSEEATAARRYARLLVSEIKLYHEAAVIAGRIERDLGTRLGGEIARARVLYEQRVPLHVRQHTDYFRDELVRTLADGDASLLQLT